MKQANLSLRLTMIATCLVALSAGCVGGGDGTGSSSGTSSGGSSGSSGSSGGDDGPSPPKSSTVESCTVTLSKDGNDVIRGETLGVTARLDARVVEGTTTREIVNDTAVTEFDWAPEAGLEEVTKPGVNTKKFYTADGAGNYRLTVTSKLSATCTAEVYLSFIAP